MLRSNEVILILLLVFLRRRIAYQISPVITEICWLLLAMRLLLPEAISVKLNVLGQQKTAQMEFKSLFVGWRWIGCSILCMGIFSHDTLRGNGRSRQTSTLYYAPYLGTTSM